MEKAKLSVIHYDIEDVISTSSNLYFFSGLGSDKLAINHENILIIHDGSDVTANYYNAAYKVDEDAGNIPYSIRYGLNNPEEFFFVTNTENGVETKTVAELSALGVSDGVYMLSDGKFTLHAQQ